VKPEVRAILKAAADEKGISLSQEIEQRIAGYLADPEIYKLAIEIAALVANVERTTGEKTTQDAYTLDAVLAGIKSLLAAKRVPGPAVIPEAVKQRYSHLDEKTAAALQLPEAIGTATATATMTVVWSAPRPKESSAVPQSVARSDEDPSYTTRSRTGFLGRDGEAPKRKKG